MGQANSVVVQQELLGTQALINASITSLQTSKSDKAPALIEKYKAVLANVNTTIADLSGADLNNSETTMRINQAETSYTAQVANLNVVKNEILSHGDNTYAILIIKFLIYAAAQIFAIIIISHVFLHETIYKKILYAFWGCLLYPFVLMYGIYNPPAWQAILFPIIDIEKGSWMNTPFYKFIFHPFAYSRLRHETANTGKMALRIFSGMLLIAFGATFMY